MKRKYNETIISAFLTQSKPSEIQKAAGISPNKYYRLIADPEFQKIVNERRTAIVKEAVLKMQRYLSKDVEILQKIIEDPETAKQIKINGINLLMNQLGNWIDRTDILERLLKLEEIARKKDG